MSDKKKYGKWKNIRKSLAVLLVGIMLLSGCSQNNLETAKNGSTQESEILKEDNLPSNSSNNSIQNLADNKNETVMGRFEEKKVELPEEMVRAAGLTAGGEIIRLADYSGKDMISKDNGESVQLDTNLNQTLMQRLEDGAYVNSCAVTPQGERLVVYLKTGNGKEGIDSEVYLYKTDGTEMKLEGIPQKDFLKVYYALDGYFYMFSSKEVSQIDPQTGENKFLFEVENLPEYLAVCGQYLIVEVDKDLFCFYDLEQKTMIEQDEVLVDFLEEYGGPNDAEGSYSYLLYNASQEDSIYILTSKGLYHHVMYGSIVEQIIDGSLCSIGDLSKSFVGMIAVADKENQGKDTFFILYSDGSFMHYVYNPEIPTVPDTTLCIYSVYENEDIRRVVSAFQQKSPDVYVKYEVGVTDGNGVTKEDALKNLSTQLAAGQAPDVFIMDDIPYASYVEKGVLADISSLIQGEEYFSKIIDSYRIGEKLYTVPITVFMPVLAKEKGITQKAEDLKEFADWVEQTRQQNPSGSILGFADAESALSMLSLASSGAWIKEDGSFNKEAVTEFLTQSKRIYNAQMQGLGEEEKEKIAETQYNYSSYEMGELGGFKKIREDSMEKAVGIAMIQKQVFLSGFLSGDISSFAFTQAELEAIGQDFVRMPGQVKNSCTASGLLAVNAASKQQEAAKEFVKYAISKELQSELYLRGIPINKEAFEQKKICPYEDKAFAVVSFAEESDSNGSRGDLEISWPTQEQLDYLSSLIEDLEQVNICDDMVYEAVIEFGKAALTEEKTIEQAVNEIESKVQLHLAE